jgi:hypothetical protein
MLLFKRLKQLQLLLRRPKKLKKKLKRSSKKPRKLKLRPKMLRKSWSSNKNSWRKRLMTKKLLLRKQPNLRSKNRMNREHSCNYWLKSCPFNNKNLNINKRIWKCKRL